jgi:cytochrome c5
MKKLFSLVAVSALLVMQPVMAGGNAGEATYKKACMNCHAQGMAGSPKLGDKAAWKARIKTGKPALYNSALKGKGAMPAKGGQAALTDAEVKAAVDYMIAKSK